MKPDEMGGGSLHETTTIGVALPDGTAYRIEIGADLMDGLAAHPSMLRRRRVCIVSDSNVAPLYAGRVEAQCAAAGVASSCFVFEAGEASKTLATLALLFEHLAAVRLLRGDAIVALGGGVVGDLAGFAAAIWMRGIDCIQLPTTLLAMVDSSVGGKTAVDLPAGKNLVGAFHQPVAVVSDTEVLTTLPGRELRAGLAEVVKYAAIGDPALFSWLEAHAAALLALEPSTVAQAISASCAAKATIVAEDPSERGCRVLLNFGHSFGHALEAEAGYGELLHGEAVSIGMMLAAHTSVRLGLAPLADTQRLRLLLQRLQLPTRVPEALRSRTNALVTRMALDKKNLGDRLRLVLWRGIGQAITHEAEASWARAAFDSAD